MLLALLITFFCIVLEKIKAGLPPWSFHVATDGILAEVLRFFFSLDAFLPVHDGFIPAAGLMGGLYTFIVIRWLVLYTVALVRGMGVGV